MIRLIINLNLFYLIYICELIKFTNNKYYYNLLYQRQFLQKCREASAKKNEFFSLLLKLYLDIESISFEYLVTFSKKLKLKDFKKIIKVFTQQNPEMSLQLLDRTRRKSDLAFIYRSFLFPSQSDESTLKNLLKKKPSLIFNLYNHYHYYNASQAEKTLNQYFNSNNLLPLTKVNENKPLYIDNIAIVSHIESKKNYGQVSIIVSAKNEELLIEGAIQSLINQSYKNIEIIFINDASSDKTLDVFINTCNKHKFKNFKTINLDRNVGPFYCMNLGMQAAKGDFITFHGADDWAHPQRISAQLNEIIKRNAMASMSKLIRIKPTGELFSKHIYPLNRICVSSLLFKRQVIKDLGYFYTDLLGSDSEYPERIRLFYSARNLIVSPLVLTLAAHRNDSRTTCNKFGTANFGINKRRLLDLEILMERLYDQFKFKKSYYVPFNKKQYSL
ncbi:glycosyl transferase, family 2 [Legionella beliardensis]|uniref:Glycosyl transferase, family 2 n=1 Tax=Legionella beliardensis TaxID=91822 RepID=A0A378I182_9GAMM|nr:glycosyltransferase family 2 protein [Legionella beliardensis]STX28909.1 glycosyl transferase, family 2 [Legionella beliardensis]